MSYRRDPEHQVGLVPPPSEAVGIDRLRSVMRALRDPQTGCPWDLEQTFETIAPYTIEEAYEVADAITEGDLRQIRDELGDLLLQVVYHAQIADEADAFDFDAVAHGIASKMIRRHPHVFQDSEGVVVDGSRERPQAVRGQWEAQKEAERRALAESQGREPSVLDGVGLALPALMRAEKLQKRAARVGFDWREIGPVIGKIREELSELEAELATADPARITDEMGDVLFACANLARHLKVDPEEALRSTNRKFEKRFRHVEMGLRDKGRDLAEATLDEMEALWAEAKARGL